MIPLLVPIGLGFLGGFLLYDKSYANGGSIDRNERFNQYEMIEIRIKAIVARLIGIDSAIYYLEKDYVVNPYRLLQQAVLKEFITVDEIDKNLWYNAVQTADSINEDYMDSGEGFGSSDMNSYIFSMLSNAGFNMQVVDDTYQRKYSKGGSVRINYTDECIKEVIKIINLVQPIKDWYIVDNKLVIVFVDDFMVYSAEAINHHLKEFKECHEVMHPEININYNEDYKSIYIELKKGDATIGKFFSGGMVNKNKSDEQWVLYNPKDYKVIGVYKSHRSAKAAMNALWKTSKYDALGIEMKSEWDKTYKI